MKVTHTHHIIPRHAGGTDDPSNLIELTVEEHAEAHRVLYEQYGRKQDLLAYKMLSGLSLQDPEVRYLHSALGGEKQGKINAETGHIQRVQTLSIPFAGKAGGAATMRSGKGAFADPVERLKSCIKGGEVQGKINATNGHLKRITHLSSRTTGMFWITNGKQNKMVKLVEDIPEGYYKGKIQK